jgi:hypothetical protein
MNRLTVIALLCISFNAYAACDGSLTLADVPVLKTGDTATIVAYTNINPSLGLKNWDIVLKDEYSNVVIVSQSRVSGDTFTLAANLPITESFINGNYALMTRLQIVNASNFNQVICESTASKTVRITSNRTAYTTGTLTLSLLPGFASNTSSYLRYIEVGGAIMPVNITTTGMPFPTDFRFSTINLSNFNTTFNITTPGFCYTYDEMTKCREMSYDKDRVIEKYSTLVIPRFDNITTGCFDLMNNMASQVNDSKQNYQMISRELISQKDQYNNLFQQYIEQQNNITQLNKEKDDIRLNLNALVFYVAGMISLVLVIQIRLRQKKRDITG